MNPLVLFDYVYYRIAYLYENTFNRKTSNEFSGITILSLFQLINILTLLHFYKPIDKIAEEPIIVYCSGYFIILALNLIRYKKFVDYTKLSGNWDCEKGISRIVKVAFVICYFILSIAFYVYSVSIN